MDTHYGRKKGFRDKLQSNIYFENHNRIVAALQKANPKEGITRRELMKIANIKSPRILRDHLSKIGAQIDEANGKLFWKPNYEKFKLWEEQINELVSKLELYGMNSEKILGGVLVIIPRERDNSLFYDTAWISIDTWRKIEKGLNYKEI